MARAMVPFPLAAGPSTAITRSAFDGLFAPDFFPISLAKPRALTGPYRYGKARPRTPPEDRSAQEFKLETTCNGEARMGRQAHLPQVLDPLLRPRRREPGALHQLRQ